MIDLIIFDLDGVLVDTEHIHYSALCDSINHFTNICHEEIKSVIKTDGSTTKSKLRVLKSIYNLTDEICDQINKLKQETVLKEFAHIVPNKEQLEMLSSLSQSYKLAIGSNSRRLSVDTLVDALSIRKFFTYVICIDDINIEKPDPAIFNYIMKLMNIDKENTLILEDSAKGIESVLRSGAHLLVTTIDTTTSEYIQDAIRKIETNNRCADGGSGLEVC